MLTATFCKNKRKREPAFQNSQLYSHRSHNGTIKVSSNGDDYNGIDVIEDCLAETMSDDEYASANEFFSSDEDMFSSKDYLMSKFSKDGVNVIVLCFNDSAPVEIE